MPETAQVASNTLFEMFNRGKIENILNEKRTQSRLDALLAKFHVVAGISIPIPNIVAFNEIRSLPTDDTARWVAEALFILRNQDDPDVLFLRGDDRQRMILKTCKGLKAYAVARYFIAIREVINGIEKKNMSFSETLQTTAQNLIKLAASSPSLSNSDGPSAPSVTN